MSEQQFERPSCATCPYWIGNHGVDATSFGMCVRFPPRIVEAIIGDGNPKHDAVSKVLDDWPWRQPMTNDDCTCGEHPDFPAWIKAARAN